MTYFLELFGLAAMIVLIVMIFSKIIALIEEYNDIRKAFHEYNKK